MIVTCKCGKMGVYDENKGWSFSLGKDGKVRHNCPFCTQRIEADMTKKRKRRSELRYGRRYEEV